MRPQDEEAARAIAGHADPEDPDLREKAREVAEILVGLEGEQPEAPPGLRPPHGPGGPKA